MGARGRLSGSPWAQPSLVVSTLGGHLFHIHFCALPFAPNNQIFVRTCAQHNAKLFSKCNSKSKHVYAPFVVVFRSARKSEHVCLGHACAVQITSGTNHLEHEMGAKVLRKGSHIHRESMIRTSPRKYIEQICALLRNTTNFC